MRRLGSSLKTVKNSTTPSAKAISSRLRRHSQSSAKLRPTSPALRASQAVRSAPSTSSVPVESTIARSSSLAIGQERRSSVSNTSLSAARSPPNSRVENHKNSGSPTAVSRTRCRTTPASTRSTCANAASVTPPAVLGSRRPSSSCKSTWCVVTWCWTRKPRVASSSATNGIMVRSRSNDSALARKGMLSSKAASKVRRAMPVSDRCQPPPPPPSTLTRRARPPRRHLLSDGAVPLAARRCPGAAAWPQRDAVRAPPVPWRAALRLPLPPGFPAAVRAHPPSLPRDRATRAAAATAGREPRHRARARTGSRVPRRDSHPTGTVRTPSPPPPPPPSPPPLPRPARSFTRLHVVGRCDRDRARLRVRLQRGLDVAIGDGARIGDTQLLEQEGKRLLQIGRDGGPHVRRHVPQAALEGPDGL